MKKALLLTLFLSSLFMLYSQSMNVASEIKGLNAECSLVDNSSDIENYDTDSISNETILYVATQTFDQEISWLEHNIPKLKFTAGFIRAPPKSHV